MDAKFAIGDKVDLSPRDKFVGTVKAVFRRKKAKRRTPSIWRVMARSVSAASIPSSLTIVSPCSQFLAAPVSSDGVRPRSKAASAENETLRNQRAACAFVPWRSQWTSLSIGKNLRVTDDW